MSYEYIYDAWLARMVTIPCDARHYLISLYGSPRAVYEAPEADLKQTFANHSAFSRRSQTLAEILKKDLSAAERNLNEAARFGAELLSYYEPDGNYPEHLRMIADAPLLLFCKGDVDIIKRPGISIVGTRRCSPYGRWIAGECGKTVARLGLAVISGMAEGIDSAVHKGCLQAGGKTAAVFGTGLDVCFPASNTALYEEIAGNGLIISEYDFGSGGHAQFFPLRNRIISGLSSKMIVVEGSLKSGSLISAGLAAEQDREVIAVPGNINQPGSRGVNQLIADGATPLTSLDDLPRLLGFAESRRKAETVKALTADETRLYKLITEAPGCGPDYLQLHSGLEISVISTLLISLELKKLIRRTGAACYAE